MEYKVGALFWYGYENMVILDWGNPTLNFRPISKQKETPTQKIKRLVKRLADKELKNEIFNDIIDVFDAQYGAGLRKKCFLKESLKKDKKIT